MLVLPTLIALLATTSLTASAAAASPPMPIRGPGHVELATPIGTLDTAPVTPSNLAVSPCYRDCDPVIATTVSPELSAVVSDPDSGTIHGDFEVRRVGESTLLATGSSPPVASGETARFTMPAGLLIDGRDYEFRVGARDATTTTWSGWSSFQVVVDDAASAPDALGLSPCLDSCAAWVTDTATPTITASGAADVDSPRVDYRFQLRTSAGVDVASGAVKDVTIGEAAHWLVPVGAVTSGTYEVRAGAADEGQTSQDQPTWGPWQPFAVQLRASTPTSPGCANITGQVTWTAENSPYLLTCGVTVQSGGRLRLEPGTVVKAQPGGAIVVRDGQLLADGSANRPVVFTSHRDDAVMGDTNGDGGSTSPARGDYPVVIRFSEPVSAERAAATPTSRLDNVSFNYGGRSTGGYAGGCHGSDGTVYAGKWSRVLISHSEFVNVHCNALSVNGMYDGIGTMTVTNTRFATSIGGAALDQVFSGSYVDSVFENTGGSVVTWSTENKLRLQFTGNYFAGYFDVRASGVIPPELFEFHHNAVVREPSGGGPVDLTYNWWGYDLNAKQVPDCWVEHVPAYVKNTNAACPQSNYRGVNKKINGGYQRKVLPALSAPPPFPDAGLELFPAQPWGADRLQQLGIGSEFGHRASGEQADPVNSATGSYTEQMLDASVANVGYPLALQRTYNSADVSSGALGRGWSMGLEHRLDFPDPTHATLISGDGQRVNFTLEDGSWRGGRGVTAELFEVAGGYEVRTRSLNTFWFGSAGRPRSILDRNDEGITLIRDSDGHIDTASSSGRVLDFTYTAAGKLDRIDLPDGRYVDYTYTDGLLASVRDLGGGITRYEYNDEDRLVAKTDPANIEAMRLAYDPTTGRVSDQWHALDHHTGFDWDPVEEVSTMTDPRGGRWIDDYDNGVLFARVDPRGRCTFYEFDRDLQLTKTRNPRGDVTRMTYDEAGDIVRTSGPTGTVTTSYNNRHDPVQATNAKGVVSNYRYDNRGNLLEATRTAPSGTALSESWVVNDRGLVVSHTNAANKATTFAYNSNGDLTEVTSPHGRRTTYAYDATGRLTSSVDPRGYAADGDPAQYTTTFTYNDRDRLTSTRDALGNTTSQVYDVLGRVASTIDANNNTTRYGYDDSSHLTSVTEPDTPAATTSFTYDSNGNNTTVTDPSGRVVTYTYDLAGQVTTTNGPQGAHTYSYDNNGHLASAKGPGDTSPTGFRYNPRGLLTAIDYPSLPDVSFTNDVHGNRRTMTDGQGTTTYGYDDFDRLTTVARGSTTFTYQHDPRGLITATSGPAGPRQYTYTDDGLLSSVAGPGGNLAAYTYDVAGNPTAATHGNGSRWTRSYDRAGRLTGIKHLASDGSVMLDDAITRDGVGNPTTIRHGISADPPTLPPASIPSGVGVDTYTYDARNRLTGVCWNALTCTGAIDYVRWTYDPSNNRTQEARPSGTTNYTYDTTTGRLSSLTGASGTTSFSYDPAGRLTSDGTSTYTYNQANVLTSQTSGGTTTSYTYDGDGRRLTAQVGTSGTPDTVTKFWWDPLSYQLTAEADGAGALLRSHHYGLGPIGFTSAASTTASYFHTDIQGSITAVTGPDGAVDRTSVYEPYGVVRNAQVLDPSAPSSPLGWAGEYTEPDGQSHLRARRYNPAIGAFTSPDPAASTNASATYTYAGANPMTSADPYGLYSLSDLAQDVNTVAPVIAAVASVGALFPPAAPILGPVAAAAGLANAAAAAYLAYEQCASNKPCGQAVVNAAINAAIGLAPFGVLRIASMTRAANTAARACSFAGATTVLMADGTRKAIEDVKVGDKVIATDPETGEQVAKTVEHVFVHDDTVIDLIVDGQVITTTEDHPFWSVTDQRFERADELSRGEKVLSADGRVITVSGLELGTTREALAYNLSIEGIHTYHVGESEILVHNTCPITGLNNGDHLPTGQALDKAEQFLGSGYTQAGPGRYLSQDGLRQVRMTDADIAPRGGQLPHMNFETWASPMTSGGRNKLLDNLHIYLPEEFP